MPDQKINDQDLNDVSAGAARQPQDISQTGPGNAENSDGPSLQQDNMDGQNINAGAARQPQDISQTGPGNAGGNDGPSFQNNEIDAQNIDAGAARQQQSFSQTGGPDPTPSSQPGPSILPDSPTEIDGSGVAAGSARPVDLSTGPGGAQIPESQGIPHVVPGSSGPSILGDGDATNVVAGAAAPQDIGTAGPGGTQSTPDIKVRVHDADLTDASGENTLQTG